MTPRAYYALQQWIEYCRFNRTPPGYIIYQRAKNMGPKR